MPPPESSNMILDLRTAMAVTTVLALSACATTMKNNQTDDVVSKEAAAVVDTVSEMSDLDTPHSPTTEQVVQNQPEAVKQNETLLYGAMTKYELMQFVEAVGIAKLQGALETDTPMTVFAPTNQAFEFAQLGADDDVAAVLKGHIIPGALDLAALRAAVQETDIPVKIVSVAGTELSVYVIDDNVRIAGPNGMLTTITQADMIQSNGVMHQVSRVLK